MKIYYHEYSAGSRKIRTIEIEAEEKPNSYFTENRRRVLKEDIGRIKGGYFKEMYTLSPDITDFVKALIDNNAREIEKAIKKLNELEEEKIRLAESLQRRIDR